MTSRSAIKPPLIYNCPWNKIQMLFNRIYTLILYFSVYLLPQMMNPLCLGSFLENAPSIWNAVLRTLPGKPPIPQNFSQPPPRSVHYSLTCHLAVSVLTTFCRSMYLLCPCLIHGSLTLLKAPHVYPITPSLWHFAQKNSVLIINIYWMDKQTSGGKDDDDTSWLGKPTRKSIPPVSETWFFI